MGWGAVAGAAIGALASSKSAKDANKANSEQAALNYEQQKEFAQHGIRWRVADARAAGLHPLAALGAQTTSFSPVAIGHTPDPIGGYLSDMGQNIDRALDQTRTRSERAEALKDAEAHRARSLQRQEQMDTLNVERHRAELQHMDMQNQLLASQIARYKSAQLGPGMPSNVGAGGTAVSAPTGSVEINPAQITSRNPSQPALEAGGATPGFKEFRIGGPKTGGVMELPNEAMSQSMESLGPLLSIPAYLMHSGMRAVDYVKNGPGTKGLPDLPSTHRWRWNPLTGTYKVVPKTKRTTHNPFKRY